MVLMNAGKAARNVASITNSGKIYGDMGGTRNFTGARRASDNRATARTLESRNIITEAEMALLGLLSVNPAGSGGVGARVLMYFSR